MKGLCTFLGIYGLVLCSYALTTPKPTPTPTAAPNAQQTPSYSMTEQEKLTLHSAANDFRVVQYQRKETEQSVKNFYDQRSSETRAKLTQSIEDVRKAHEWPKEAVYDPDKESWTLPAPTPTIAPTPTPEKK